MRLAYAATAALVALSGWAAIHRQEAAADSGQLLAEAGLPTRPAWEQAFARMPAPLIFARNAGGNAEYSFADPEEAADEEREHQAAASPVTDGSGASLAAEARYLAENDAAMAKMMNDMTVRPTGDVDRDFVAMMVPHHQGAIDMALAVLRYGHNEQLKRLAQEIIVTQQQEIAAMRLAVGEPLPPSISSPTQISPAHDLNRHRAARCQCPT